MASKVTVYVIKPNSTVLAGFFLVGLHNKMVAFWYLNECLNPVTDDLSNTLISRQVSRKFRYNCTGYKWII